MSSKLLKMNVFKPYSVYNVFSSARNAAASVIERHYLQFNGTSHYAYADAVFGGITDKFTIAIKVNKRNTVGGSIYTYFSAGGPGINGGVQSRLNQIDSYNNVTARTAWFGYNSDGTIQISDTTSSAGYPDDDNPRVFSIGREQATNYAYLKAIKSSGVEVSVTDTNCVFEIPDHIAVAQCLNNSLSWPAGFWGNVSLIGLLLIKGLPSNSELQGWINGSDARDYVSNINHYWIASDISGSSIPARVGTVPLTLSGVSSSNLVLL